MHTAHPSDVLSASGAPISTIAFHLGAHSAFISPTTRRNNLLARRVHCVRWLLPLNEIIEKSARSVPVIAPPPRLIPPITAPPPPLRRARSLSARLASSLGFFHRGEHQFRERSVCEVSEFGCAPCRHRRRADSAGAFCRRPKNRPIPATPPL